MDNCSAHNLDRITKNLSQIRVEFLPPNTTSVLQPCDQGIIELTLQNVSVVCKIDADIKYISSRTNGYVISDLWCVFHKFC